MKNLQDLLANIWGKLGESPSPDQAGVRRQIVAKTLEERILYSVTPLMMDEADASADAAQAEAEAQALEEANSTAVATDNSPAADSHLTAENFTQDASSDELNFSGDSSLANGLATWDVTPSTESQWDFGSPELTLANVDSLIDSYLADSTPIGDISPAEQDDAAPTTQSAPQFASQATEAIEDPLDLDSDSNSLPESLSIETTSIATGDPEGDALLTLESAASLITDPSPRHEIAFVDSSLEGSAELAEILSRGVEVVMLDSQQDGLAQITEALSHRSDLDAVHIFSHGVEGGIQVGGTWINEFTLDFQSDIIASWGASLSSDADLLIYGCNVASTEDGQAFIQELSTLTGADVAASSNATGAASLGGDWTLEYATGSISSQPPADVNELNSWLELLAITSNGTATSTSGFNVSSLTWSHTVASGTDRTLFVTLAIDAVGAGVSSVTYGGVAMTQVGRTAGNHAVEIWKLTNPTVGSANVVVSLGATTTIKGGAVTYNGVDQGAATGTYVGATGTGTTASVVASSATNDLVIDVTNWDNNPAGFTIGAGQTQIWSQATATHRGVTSTEAGAASVTMSSTVSASNQWEIGAVSIQAANVAPVNTVPGAQSTNEDTAKVFSSGNGNLIAISDADASGSNQVTVTVTNGALTLAGTAGLTFSAGDGNSDSTMTFSGTIANINSALNGLSYSPTANYSGGATLTISTVDSQLYAVNIDSGLKARYTFDNSSDIGNDTSPVGAYDGAVSGATAVVDGTRGNVLSFDGNDYVQIAGHFGNPANVTLAAWINLTSADMNGSEIISLGDTIILRADEGGNLKGIFYNGTTWNSVNFGVTLAGAGWHHVAFTFDDTGNTASLYLDGAVVATSTTASTLTYNQGANSFIGKHGNGDPNWDFTGKIDEARVYNRALTAAEVRSLASDLTLSDTDTVALTVNAVNDAPTLSLSGYSGAFTEGGGAMYDPGAIISDIDSADFSGGNLTYAIASGGGPGDVLSIRNVGTGVGQIGVSGANITYGGVVIGTTSGNGDDSTPMVVTFNANASVAAVQALARNITYQNTGDNPGTSTRTFNITINDGDGGTSTPTVVNISMTAVNDAPVNSTPGAQSVNEDGTLVFSSGNGNLVSISDLDANSSLMQVTLSGTHGAISLSTTSGLSFTAGDGTSDSTMTFTGTVTNINAALSGMSFSAAADYSGAASIQIITNDQGNSGTGGALSDTDTINITVNSVNDAPVRTAGTVANLTVLEDAGFTSLGFGSVAYGTGGGSDEVSQTLTYTVTVLPSSSLGSVYLADGVTQVTMSTYTLSQIQGMQFKATANLSGSTGFQYNVTDTGGTANGGLNSISEFVSITITSVNDAPTGTDKTITTNEDTAYSLTAADFGFADASDSPANTMTAVKFTTIPSGGVLRSNGSPVSAGQVVSLASINSGFVTWTPAANANGAGNASFTFQVQDNGGTANGGIDLDQTPNTITFNVTSVNDAPTGTDKTITTNEDTAYALTAADFGFGDASDSPANTLSAVKITTIPGAGTLQLNGVTVTVGQTVSVANINSGLLVWTPAANANGTGNASFTFQVQDSGGTANGGVDLDQSANTITFNVSAVNDAPVFTASSSGTYTEGDAAVYDPTITLTDVDSADFSGGTLNYSITSGGGNGDVLSIRNVGTGVGQIGLSGLNVTFGGVVIGTWSGAGDGSTPMVVTFNSNATVAAVQALAQNITYYNSSDNPGTSTRTISITVSDGDGGTSNAVGGTLTMVAVNDAPVNSTPGAQSVNEDATLVFSSGNGNLVSISDLDANSSLMQVTLSGTNGAISLSTTSGLSFSAGDGTSDSTMTFTGTVTNINAALSGMSFSATTNYNGAASLQIITNDQGNSGTGGALSDTDTINITVNSVNDAPTGTDKTITTNEDNAYTLTAADFGFGDGSDSPANALSAVKITTIPGGGALSLNGVAVTTGQTVSVANINSGLLVWTPAANANGASNTTFTFQVQDNGGTASGGVDLDQSANTITFNVTSVNDAPTGTDKTITTNEDTAYTLTASDFGFGDASDSPANALSAVKITTIPGAGSLALNGVVVTTGQTISVANINSGLLVWTPAANANGAANSTFTFQVQDNGGAANGGVDLDQSANTITFNVTAVNDEQVLAVNAGLTVTENSTNNVITAATLQTTDVDNTNSQLIYTLSSTTSHGAVKLNGTLLAIGNTFTQADISAGLVTYSHDGSETSSDSFTFSVDDGAGTTSSGTFAISVTPVNDNTPVITSNGGGATAAISIYENFSSVTTITATDADLPSPSLLYSIVGGADSSKFAINTSTGALTFVIAPDFEAPTDAGGNNIYDVIIQVDDGAFLDQQAIAVTVMDAASTLVVTTTADTNDTGLGSTFTIEQLNASKGADGHISLREAIIAANNTLNQSGADQISFDIPLSDGGFTGTVGVDGRFVIQFTTALPTITEALIIDGTTQTIAQGDTNPGMLGTGGTVGTDGATLSQVARSEISIVGASGLAAGFDVSANDVTIRGLGIQGFTSGAGIRLNAGYSGALIEGNIFGSNLNALTNPGAATHNLYHVQGIGGDSAIIQNNLFAFADSTGVYLNTGSDNWLIQNNEFFDNGINFSNGDAIAAAASNGLTIQNNRITGTSTQAVIISPGSTNVLIQNNTVLGNGVGMTGAATVQSDAIAIRSGASNVTIYRNIIADNYGAGITVNNGAAGVLISQNSMHGNGTILSRNGSAATGQVDIDLQSASDSTSFGTGPFYTANDVGDADTGGNHLQNFPVITSAQSTGTQITLGGTINSTANSTIRIEFFANTAPGTTGYGGGKRYLGFVDVTTDGAGDANFTATLTAVTSANEYVSATATDLTTHSTSEFAYNLAINEAPVANLDSGPLAYIENSGPVLVVPSATVSDGDLLDFNGGQLTVQLTSNGASEDNLAIRNQGTGAGQVGISGLDVTFGGVVVGTYGGPVSGSAALTVTFNASATADAVQAVLANVTYENTSENPATAARTFSAQVTDGDGGASTTVTRSILPGGVNDAPTATPTLDPALHDSALGFDGVNSYVQVAAPTNLSMTTSVTLEAWINLQQVTASSQIILNKEGEYEFGILADGTLGWAFANSSPGWAWISTGHVVALDEWTHVAVSYDAGVVTAYVNGAAVSTYNGSGNIGDVYPAMNSLTIGGRENATSQRFHGAIDDVRIWSTVRSQSEISSEMNTDLVGDEAGLAANWTFDEGSGTTALDKTANHNDGVLGGGSPANEPNWIDYTTLEDGSYVFSTSRFNAIRLADIDANGAAESLTLTVQHGVLTLATTSGITLVAGANGSATMTITGTLADLNAALDGLTYQASANYQGAESLELNVNDQGNTGSGGALAQSRTYSFNVLSVNDAPTGTDKTITTNEDASYTLTASDFGFGDALDSPSNTLTAVKITTVPSAGSLTLNGVVVSAGQNVTVANINSGLLVWIPAANTNGASNTSFTFQVQDNGGTANGGVDLDQSANTITFNVNSVNDAPTGTDNTITTNEDASYTLTASDFGFGDALDSPANALSAVKITTIPGAGSLTLNGVAVTAGQSISVANVNSGLLVWTPSTDANGAANTTFTFQVQDNGGTANGGVDLDQSANTITFNVNSVNDAPTGTDKTITTNEDTSYTLTASDFGFGDALDSPTNALTAVKISTIPGAGSLTLNGVTVATGQSISVANINAGLLVWTPVANASGASNTSFTFQVQDNGGTANGGVDLDQSANTITFNVNSVNDAPTGTNNSVTMSEGSSHTFTAGEFGFGDALDSPANALAGVKISTLPAAGTLTLSGVAVTSGQVVSAADIGGGLLVYSPAPGANGAGYANFTFQVQDDGGTSNGGIDLDQSANTMTLNVSSVNDAPTGTDKSITTNEDTSYTLTAADFGFGDALDSPANTLLGVKISTLPSGGSLMVNGVAVTAGQTISAANINSGLLVWTPTSNSNGASNTTFTFQVQDNGGTVNGGVDLDQSANTITFNVNSVNDAPTGTDKTITTNEDTAYTLTASDFGFGDALDSPTNALTAVKISTIPGAGSLTLNGVTVTAGQSISVANINSGLLVWTPATDANGASNTSFTFQVQDNGGTINGGVDLDQSANTITFNVNTVNDAPTGTDKTITTNEDAAYTFTAADFGFGDVLDSPANALSAVKITTIPGAGSLTLNGVAVTTGQSISVANINSGLLIWTPAANANGAANTSFTFQVQDNGGTANSGVDLDQSANTITFNVNSVNDAPTGADNTITTSEDTAYTLTASDFGFGDALDSPANGLAAVKITTIPGAGSLKLSGVTVTAGQMISVANINSGNLVWTPANNVHGAAHASFTFQVRDNGGTASGGVDLDQSANTITFDVNSVNDAPAGADKTITTNEDTAYTLTASDFGFGDALDSPANALAAVKITAIPGAGTLALNGLAVTNGQIVAVSEINSGLLIWIPDANASGAANSSFTFQVQDDGGTASGGVDLDQSANTITFNVNSVNDAPTGTDKIITTNEDAAYTLTASDFGFGDASDTPANALAAVKITTLPSAGTLTLNGVTVNSGQLISVANLNAGMLIFTPASDAFGAGYSSFTFQVQDNGGTASGGENLDQSANTIIFDVSGVNDAPTLSAPANQATPTNVPLYFSSAGGNAISIGDIDSASSQVEVQLSATDGSITLGSVSGLTITSGANGAGALTIRGMVADINAALAGMAYTPDTGFGGAASLSLVVNDLGNTGAGGPLTDSTTVAIKVGTPGVVVTPTGGLVTAEDGASAGFTFVLTTRPTADVTLTFSSGDPTEGSLSLSSLTFTAANWNIAQTITVTGVDDFVDDGDISYSILTNAATSVDVDYSGMNIADLSLTNLDDDTAGFTVTPISGPVTEAGGQATFSIVLNSQPLSSVSFSLASSDLTEATVSASSLTFNASNWNIAQVVTVTGLQDFLNDGNTPFSVILGPATSSDANYQGLNPADISAVNLEMPNQAPINSLPTGVTAAEDTPLMLQGAQALFISDIDAGGNDMQVSLSAAQGKITLARTTGLTFSAGDGADDSTVTFRGSVANINAALDGLKFLASQDFNGLTTIQVTTSDLGNSGSGGELQDTDTLSILVTPVNDRPVGGADSFVASTTQPLVITASKLLANDGDIDSGNLHILLLSQPIHGSVLMSAEGNLIYLPELANREPITFTYAVSDGDLQSTPVTVTIYPQLVAPAPGPSQALTGNTYVDFRNPSGEQSDSDSSSIASGQTSHIPHRSAQDDGAAAGNNYDDPSMVSALELEDRNHDSDTGVWLEESRASNTGMSSIFAGALEPRRGQGSSSDGLYRSRLYDGIDLAPMGAILERVRNDLQSLDLQQQYVVGVVGVGAASMAAGYVFWALRGVQASAMLLSATPTWASFDLLPVLAGGLLRKKPKEEGESLGDIAGELSVPAQETQS